MTEEKIREIYFFAQSAENKIDKEEVWIKFLKNTLLNTYNKDEFLLNFIFLSREEIAEMNQKYLRHNYATDVITFDFSDDFGVFGGDVFICPDVIEQNAQSYGVSYKTEMLRVLCHGMLHLLGFDDKTEEPAKEIRIQEDKCIEAFLKQENL